MVKELGWVGARNRNIYFSGTNFNGASRAENGGMASGPLSILEQTAKEIDRFRAIDVRFNHFSAGHSDGRVP